VERDEAESHWYVMLFPSLGETQTLVSRFQDLAAVTGGTPNPTPHVTVGYFHGSADPQTVLDRLRPLSGPAIPVRAGGLFSWSEDPYPLSGYTLSLRVDRDEPVQRWQRAVRDVLQPLPLVPTYTWEDQCPHMLVLRHLPAPPHAILARLGDREWPLRFTASRLVVSQGVGEELVTWLDRPLQPDAPAPSE